MSIQKKINEPILVVEGDPEQRMSMVQFLTDLGHEVNTASEGDEVNTFCDQLNFDLVILDVSLPGIDGLELIRNIKELNPNLDIMACMEHKDKREFMSTIEAGASDWVAKPIDLNELKAKIERIRLERARNRELAKKNLELEKIKIEMEYIIDSLKIEIRGREGFILTERTQARETFPEIIGNSKKIEKVLDLIRLVADTNSTVLITGETGTGKELIAKAVYAHSSRNNHPFITVNCAALTETLLESELFGHEKGAFTGATKERRGLIEEADGGTLFLDEIAETTPTFQVELLRVLQYGEFKPVGSTQTRQSDIRVIIATNVSLEDKISDGTFREDLYYRLNQFPIALPPLRDRIEDLPMLSQYFLEKSCLEYNRPLVGFSSNVIEKMFRYAWPGNIRELENTVAQAVILAMPPLVELKNMPRLLENLQKHPRKTRLSDMIYAEAKEEFERNYFRTIIERTEGNISAASRLCKVERKHLSGKIKKLGLLIPSKTR